jgi:peptide/nickel transport system ATP-binding protein
MNAMVQVGTSLLEVDGLSLEFRTRSGTVKALEQVSFAVARGETVGIVGESGSGKSVMAYALLRILDAAGRITAGTARFDHIDLLAAPEAEIRELRGDRIAMIFQNPRVALNPIRRVGDQIGDVLRAHAKADGSQLRARGIELLTKVGIPDPGRRIDAYPFELSGGMCQRVMIAMALACRPALLIADEPTTGIDVTTQATIMDLVRGLARDQRMATLLITHDLGLAAEYCDRIVVMHAGHVVEDAPVDALFDHPRHPYTRRLIETTPRPGASLDDLEPIPGGLPDLRGVLPPCRYLARCERRSETCEHQPLMRSEPMPGHRVACHHPI